MRSESLIPLRVGDLKQYIYCPRVVYYHYIKPVGKKSTFKMDYGKLEEARIDKLETRRKLIKYGIGEGKRVFHLALNSERLALAGKLDLLIETPEECYPVDFKFTRGRPHKNHIYQLGGYALMVEDVYRKVVGHGFVYLSPSEDAVVFELNDALKNDIINKLSEMREMIRHEEMPVPTDNRGKCVDCEYRNYCRDVF